MQQLVIWIFAPPEKRDRAGALQRALPGGAQAMVLGPAGQPAPDLDLGPEPDLALALEACPAGLRPRACLNLAPAPPRGLDCLPCPTLGWAGGQGWEGVLPADAGKAAEAALIAARRGFRSEWLERVQVNLPLCDLLGRYRPLVEALPINLEVGLDAQALDRTSAEETQAARRMLKGRRLTAHLAFMDLAPGSRDSQVRELSRQRLLEAAELAGRLEAVQAVAHLGFDHRVNPDPAQWVERAAPVFAELAQRLAGLGCRLALENVFELDPSLHLALLAALDHLGGAKPGLCLDVGHALAFSESRLADWWEAFAPRLWEMHLHDNHGGGDEHLPVGWGKADWPFLRKGLGELEALPVLTLEPHREPHLWGSLRGLTRHFAGL